MVRQRGTQDDEAGEEGSCNSRRESGSRGLRGLQARASESKGLGKGLDATAKLLRRAANTLRQPGMIHEPLSQTLARRSVGTTETEYTVQRS